MTKNPVLPSDPDLYGVPDALRRAAENARRLAEQTGTPFVVRKPVESGESSGQSKTISKSTDPTASA